MKYYLTILALVFSISGYSQLSTYHDSINCATTSTTLHALIVGDIPTSTGITGDDNYSGLIPIGFTFNFYGTPNTQCVIGSNGNICFNLGLAGSYDPWPISAALLGNSSVYNSVCGPWCDMYIPAGGTITYANTGTAPNRTFEVTYCTDHMYSCTTEYTTTQIIFYETTNIVEVHLTHKTSCSWNSGRAIIGVQNATGTLATAAPLRDWTPSWSATNEAWRFTPSGGTYVVSSIPYAPIPYASSTIYWYDSATHAYLGSGPTLTVAPVVGTTYAAAALGCNDTSWSYLHVIAMPGLVSAGSQVHITHTASSNPTICGKCDGEIDLIGVNPHVLDSIFYSKGGMMQPVLLDSAGADSTLRLRNLCAGTYDWLYVKQGNCPSNQVGPIVLAAPPMSIMLDYLVRYGCTSDNVYFNNHSTPGGANYTYQWNFGDGTAVNTTYSPAHTYAAQGVYTVNYTFGTTFGCHFDSSFSVNTLHPLDAHYTVNANAVCLGTPIHFDGTTVSTNVPVFSWDFGNGTAPVAGTTSVDYTYPAAGKYTATLTVTDSIGCQATATDTFEVISIAVNTSVADTSVCLRDSMAMQATVKVVPSYVSYEYSWTPTNNIGYNMAPTANFMGIGTYKYTVTVTTPAMVLDAGGCSASDTETIHSYPPVVLGNLTPNQTIAFGSPIQLNATGAIYYRWTPADGSLDNTEISNPVATPQYNTTYTVYGMNLFGCLDSATIAIDVDPSMTEALPTAFTPNGDGLNDVFRLTHLKFQKLVEFNVYNRWGQQVFRTGNPEIGWDGTYNGTPQDIGTYHWQVIIARPDGTNKTYKGDVTLIR